MNQPSLTSLALLPIEIDDAIAEYHQLVHYTNKRWTNPSVISLVEYTNRQAGDDDDDDEDEDEICAYGENEIKRRKKNKRTFAVDTTIITIFPPHTHTPFS